MPVGKAHHFTKGSSLNGEYWRPNRSDGFGQSWWKISCVAQTDQGEDNYKSWISQINLPDQQDYLNMQKNELDRQSYLTDSGFIKKIRLKQKNQSQEMEMAVTHQH